MIKHGQHADLRRQHLTDGFQLQLPLKPHDVQRLGHHLPRAVGITLLQIGVQLVLPPLQPAPIRILHIEYGVVGVGFLIWLGVGKQTCPANKRIVGSVPTAVHPGMVDRQRHIGGAAPTTIGSLQQQRVLLPQPHHSIVANGDRYTPPLQLRDEPLIIRAGKTDRQRGHHIGRLIGPVGRRHRAVHVGEWKQKALAQCCIRRRHNGLPA